MAKLTIEVDIDTSCSDEVGEILTNLMTELTLLRERCYDGDPTIRNASGLVLNPLDDDALVGNWRIDE